MPELSTYLMENEKVYINEKINLYAIEISTVICMLFLGVCLG